LFPDRKTTVVWGSKFLTAVLISKSYISYSALLSTSVLNFENTQGKKQLIKKLGIGVLSFTTCLQRLLKHLYDESATMNSTLPYKSAVAAPMLLPQRMTLYLRLERYYTIVLACPAYRYPRETESISTFLPQPMKSNVAKETPSGRYLIRDTPSSLHDDIPCMYNIK